MAKETRTISRKKAEVSGMIAASMKQYLEDNRISNKQASVILDMDPSTVSVYLGGRRFTPKTAVKWSDKLGFNSHYLVTGKGSLIDGTTKADPHPLTSKIIQAQARLLNENYKFKKYELPLSEAVIHCAKAASMPVYQEDSKDKIFEELRAQNLVLTRRVNALEKVLGTKTALGTMAISAMSDEEINKL
ncbi:MAG: hypothetical protein ILA23_06940 [Bacteroidales bacterium]|nr:hypothetical protein [Bacteroidales bacterium]